MKPTGKGITGLILEAIQRLYPELKIDTEEIEKLVVPSRERGADVRFMAAEFAAEAGLERAAFISALYLGLVVEQEKEWFEREFYGIFRDDEAIYFRLVDDSTS